jgi:anti-sigma regulatory factor (Ser/Thr protein kinase)
MLEKRIKLVIDSNLEDVRLVSNVIRQLCILSPLTDLQIFHIELAVVESVNNVIKHSYNNEPGHEVEVIFTLYSNRITFDVCDVGRTMDCKYRNRTDKSPLEFDPTELNKLPERGLGLAIIREVMDDVAYSRCLDKNTLTLTKRFIAHDTRR